MRHEPIRRGPGMPTLLDASWTEALGGLSTALRDDVLINRGWDLAWERAGWRESAAKRAEIVSVRLYDDEVIVGPRWVPGTDSGCAGCAEVRERNTAEHPLLGALTERRVVPRSAHPLLPELFTAALDNLADHPLRPGELYAVGTQQVRRHRVPRSFYCPICTRRRTWPDRNRLAVALRDEPLSPDDPSRGDSGKRLVRPGALRARLVDARYGPIQTIMRESVVPFAMSMCLAPDAAAMGHGRATTFADSEPVGIIETYERLGSFPFDTAVLTDRAYADLSERAVAPATLGEHTEEQLAHPSCRVVPCTADTPIDWVRGLDLDTLEPWLVPAEIAFYQYEHRFKLDRQAARAAGRTDGHTALHKHFHESSSGCAAGASLGEAALHSLFELAERDAFLLAWHREQPLPRITGSSITDPESRTLIDLVQARGFDIHVLVATQDIALPIVWVLVVNRRAPFPATYSSGGSGANPASAIRSALREVAQLVTNQPQWSRAEAEPMLDDPWLVIDLEHHHRLYTLPERRSRATAVLGGPDITVDEAFPGWPDLLRRASGGSVLGALDHVRDLYAQAGLDRIVLVDQTTREHADTGIAVAKAVVPGILPMCFGHAQQRLRRLPRLAAALAGTASADREIPYDPHPFP